MKFSISKGWVGSHYRWDWRSFSGSHSWRMLAGHYSTLLGGYFSTLIDTGWQAPEIEQNVNTDELGDLALTADGEEAIVAFMKTLPGPNWAI